MNTNEPVFASALSSLIVALCGVLTAFNVPVTDIQRQQILGLVVALVVVVHLVGSWWARRKVTPVSNPKTADGVPLVPLTPTVAAPVVFDPGPLTTTIPMAPTSTPAPMTTTWPTVIPTTTAPIAPTVLTSPPTSSPATPPADAP